jgi:putative DNA primase/helicase
MTRSDPQIATVAEQWDVDLWALNTPSGVINLRTGELRPASPSDHMTKITAVAPSGECPLWLAFLRRAMDNNDEMIAFLQRAVGCALVGEMLEHVLFFLYGGGRNGKGVFLNTVSKILGDYATTAAIDTFTESTFEKHPTDLAGLRGARLVSASETEKGRHWAEAKIKRMTGGDPIKARFMRQDFFEFDPQFTLFISGNHRPSLRTVDEAIKARFKFIPFNVTIPEHERDPALQQKLKAEWPGILAWAVQGCLAWQRDGLRPPEVVRAATADYLSSEDALGTWIEERLEDDLDPEALISRDVLFGSWAGWARAAGEEIGTSKQFLATLRNRTDRKFVEGKKTGVRGFRGIRIRPIPTPEMPQRAQFT